MNANELRIGNIVSSNRCGQLVVQYIPDGIDMSNYEPIPITEEWLERFGFTYLLEMRLYSKSGHDVELIDNGIEFYLGPYGSWFKYVQSVHQLQNLYFALTGEELTLK